MTEGMKRISAEDLLHNQKLRHFLANPHPRRRRGAVNCASLDCAKLALKGGKFCAPHTDGLLPVKTRVNEVNNPGRS